MSAIEGVLPVIPTPFREGAFDPESFQAMVDHMIEHVDGYTLLGSTGEAPSMTLDERMEIAEAAIAMTPADKKVVVGVTSTCSADAVELTRHAQEQNAAAVLCASPFYFTNTSEGILGFLREIDEAADIDIVFYDNPMATKTAVDASAVVDWAAQLQHLQTVKLTDHDLDKIDIWHGSGLNVIGGDDPILFEYLAGGVDGVMMIAPMVFPVAFHDAWSLARAGDQAGGLSILATEVLPFVHVFGIGREIATTKALLADIGVFASGELRVPLTPVSSARRAYLRQAYDLGIEATRKRRSGEGVAA